MPIADASARKHWTTRWLLYRLIEGETTQVGFTFWLAGMWNLWHKVRGVSAMTNLDDEHHEDFNKWLAQQPRRRRTPKENTP